MKAFSAPHTPSLPAADRRSPLGWLLVAGVTVGTLDLVFAAGFWSLRDGVAPIRIAQSIASWVLGHEAAFAGGWTTALLGVGLYFYLTTAMVTGYHLLAARHRVLLRRPVLAGGLYGLAMYGLLFQVAVPLLALEGARPQPVEWTIACVLAYAVLIGIPGALFVRHGHGDFS